MLCSALNEPLAKFYGVAGVEGPEFRKVKLPAGSHRGGVLTQASETGWVDASAAGGALDRGQSLLVPSQLYNFGNVHLALTNLNVSYGTGTTVTLSGKVVDPIPEGVAVSFSGMVSGSAVTAAKSLTSSWRRLHPKSRTSTPSKPPEASGRFRASSRARTCRG